MRVPVPDTLPMYVLQEGTYMFLLGLGTELKTKLKKKRKLKDNNDLGSMFNVHADCSAICCTGSAAVAAESLRGFVL